MSTKITGGRQIQGFRKNDTMTDVSSTGASPKYPMRLSCQVYLTALGRRFRAAVRKLFPPKSLIPDE
jgi:hypothetical protein